MKLSRFVPGNWSVLTPRRSSRQPTDAERAMKIPRLTAARVQLAATDTSLPASAATVAPRVFTFGFGKTYRVPLPGPASR